MLFQFQFLLAFWRTTVYVYNRLPLILTTRWPGPPHFAFQFKCIGTVFMTKQKSSKQILE